MATGNAPRGFPRILQWLLAGLMLIIGLAVGILGAKLALVGGTLYFALMGVVMVIAAVLIFRNRRGGILLYAVAFIASVIWAISDAGWNYWPLFSRLFALGVLACLLIPNVAVRLLCVGLTMAAVLWTTSWLVLWRTRHG